MYKPTVSTIFYHLMIRLKTFQIRYIPKLLRAQWPFATYLYIAGLWAYLQNIYKVKIYKTTYW